MLSQKVHLAHVQDIGLGDDPRRHTETAQVMEEGRHPYRLGVLRAEAEGPSQSLRILRHPLRMAQHVLAASIHQRREGAGEAQQQPLVAPRRLSGAEDQESLGQLLAIEPQPEVIAATELHCLVHQGRIEGGAGKLPQRGHQAPSRGQGAGLSGDQRLGVIGQGQNAGREWYLLALQARRIAGAVPSLVVGEDDVGDRGRQVEPGDGTRPQQRVLVKRLNHGLERAGGHFARQLLRRPERRSGKEVVLGDTDQGREARRGYGDADVMEEGSVEEGQALLAAQSYLQGQDGSDVADALGMAHESPFRQVQAL